MEIKSLKPKERLIEAIRKNDIGAVELLLTQHRELLHEPLPRVDGGAALSLAAQCNNLKMVEVLVQLGSKDLQQALSRASMHAHREVSEYLVQKGADPNGLYSDTAIHYGPVILAACETLNSDGIRLLIALGADPNVKYRTSRGNINSPTGFILGTYVRDPQSKHKCLEG